MPAVEFELVQDGEDEARVYQETLGLEPYVLMRLGITEAEDDILFKVRAGGVPPAMTVDDVGEMLTEYGDAMKRLGERLVSDNIEMGNEYEMRGDKTEVANSAERGDDDGDEGGQDGE